MRDQTKKDFIKYLEEHPQQRFWQAVRNFSGYAFILASNNMATLRDTFYWEGRNEMSKGRDTHKPVKKPKKNVLL